MPRMAELKTRETTASVGEFLNAIPDEQRRKDCKAIAALMRKATNKSPKMWGTSIVGFDKYQYQGRSQGGEWFVMGFSPRSANLTLYLLAGPKNNPALLKKLGKHSLGGSCLYIKRLSDVDTGVLEQLIAWAAKAVPLGSVQSAAKPAKARSARR
jgi:hypothetical protein